MTYPIAPLGVRIRAAVGIYDPTTDPSTWPWTDITLDVDHLVPIEDSIGGPDDDSDPDTTLSFALKNDTSRIATTVTGRYTADNAESDLYPFFDVGCAIEYALDVGDGGGYDVQVIAFVATLENDWPSNTQYRSIARVSCVGELQRGAVFSQQQRSPMYRTIMNRRNLGFWPLEDSDGATTATSAVRSQPPLKPYAAYLPLDFGAEALTPGVASSAKISTGQSMTAYLTQLGAGTGIRAGFLMQAGTNPAGFAELVSISNSASWRFALEIGTSQLRFRAYNNASAEVSGAAGVGFNDHLFGPVYYEVQIDQISSGTLQWTITGTRWALSSAGAPIAAAGTANGTFSGTLGNASQVLIAAFANINDVRIAALNITEPAYPPNGGYAAVLGWAGNTATGRVQGMCNEVGVPSSVTSTSLGAVMGPQLIDTLRANLLDVRNTDHGVLSDHTGKVTYRALSELYNLAPAITLTRTIRGQLGDIPAVRDDSAKVNRVTVKRAGGGSTTQQDSYDILIKGLYEGQPGDDLNVATDGMLTPQAGWYLARGVATGYRYGELTMHMRVAAEVTPALAGQVAALQLGDRIAISSLPPQAAKGGIERQVRGRKQTVLNRGMKQWDVTYSMVPTEAYQAFILDTDRLDTSGTEVILAASTTDTVLMTATAGALPATGTGQSIALDAAGEQVLLTGVASEVISDSFGRTVASGWGSVPATTHLPAYAWSPVAPTTDYAVNGSVAQMTISSAPASRQVHLTGLLGANLDHTIFGTVPVLAAGGNIELQVNYRNVLALLTGYGCRVVIEPAATTRLQLYVPGNNNPIVDIPLPYTHTAGATYGIRIAPIWDLHRIKVWQGTTTISQPANWQVQVQDATRITPGYPLIRAGRGSGNTNSGLVISWDNFTVDNVQAFTVSRSQGGGVVKAQALGNLIKLWRGKGLGI